MMEQEIMQKFKTDHITKVQLPGHWNINQVILITQNKILEPLGHLASDFGSPDRLDQLQ